MSDLIESLYAIDNAIADDRIKQHFQNVKQYIIKYNTTIADICKELIEKHKQIVQLTTKEDTIPVDINEYITLIQCGKD
jgi:hypothetical protein